MTDGLVRFCLFALTQHMCIYLYSTLDRSAEGAMARGWVINTKHDM